MYSIEEIKSNMSLGGDRPSRFWMQVTIPGISTGEQSASEKFTYRCRVASIPSMELGVVQVPYFGRKIKLPGDRTWPNLEVVIQEDEDYGPRRALEQWSHRINTVRKNTTFAPFSAAPASYKSDMFLYKGGKGGDVIRVYKFVGCWPALVAPIQVDWNATDAISEYQVVFAYDNAENDDSMNASEGSGLSNATG